MTDHYESLPINTAQNTDTQHVWNNASHREFNGIFLYQCLSATFQAVAWQCFHPKEGSPFFVPLDPELRTQLYKHSSQQEAGKRNGRVWHHTWWATIIGCRPSKGGDIKSSLYILNFQEGGKKMEDESTTWTGSCCCYLVISEAWSSRADLQGKSLKHIIRAEIGKLKSSVPLTHILSQRVPSSS